MRAAPCLHQGGDGLPQVQVAKVTGRDASGRVHAGVDLHLGRTDADSDGGKRTTAAPHVRLERRRNIACSAQRGLHSSGGWEGKGGGSLESYLVEFAGHLGVFLPQRLAEGQGTGSSDGQETRPGHQQLLSCPT